jgi:hypothetical protein
MKNFVRSHGRSTTSRCRYHTAAITIIVSSPTKLVLPPRTAHLPDGQRSRSCVEAQATNSGIYSPHECTDRDTVTVKRFPTKQVLRDFAPLKCECSSLRYHCQCPHLAKYIDSLPLTRRYWSRRRPDEPAVSEVLQQVRPVP